MAKFVTSDERRGSGIWIVAEENRALMVGRTLAAWWVRVAVMWELVECVTARTRPTLLV
ncbi:MAG: hypothetical protein ACKO81_03710 [Planctomycetota bacterium]